MSRSAKDATRFTQTAPHAYSRNGPSSASSARSPGFQSTQFPVGGQPIASSGTGETPSQKVARLRAEHLRRKAAQLTAWDKTVLVGRRMSNRLHVLTVAGLLTLSVMAAGISVFSVGDMIIYNNRKKREFADAYRKLWEQRHEDALKAQSLGIATETQLKLIRQEREAQDDWERKNTHSVWQRVRGVFSTQGLSNDARGTQSWKEKQDFLETHGMGFIKNGEKQADGGPAVALDGPQMMPQKDLRDLGRGGPLDQMADHAASRAAAGVSSAPRLSSWFAWGSKESNS